MVCFSEIAQLVSTMLQENIDFTNGHESSFSMSFHCPKCGKIYKQKQTLTRHLTYECGQDPKFVCEVCLKKFKQKIHLRSHFLRCHCSSSPSQVLSNLYQKYL